MKGFSSRVSASAQSRHTAGDRTMFNLIIELAKYKPVRQYMTKKTLRLDAIITAKKSPKGKKKTPNPKL